MIVADASGLIALGSVGALELVVEAFDLRTTAAVLGAVEGVSGRHGWIGDGARTVLATRDQVTVDDPPAEPIVTSRLDRVAGGCVALARTLDAAFVLTDERHAIHEIRRLTSGDVVTPAIALAALVRTGTLSRQDARFRLAGLLDRRYGLEKAIGGREAALFEP